MDTQGQGVEVQSGSTDCDYDGSLGPLVDVRRCGCGSPCCVFCGGSYAWRRARAWVEDCKRMGVERVALLTVTRDPERFPDPDHVVNAKVAHHLMLEVWDVLGRGYREKWGERPIWWAFREVHDGKRGGDDDSKARGAQHLHIYFPCPTESGRIGPEKLTRIRECGVGLAGRTTWGWQRQGVYVLDVTSASPYAAKGINYAVKGAIDDRMLDSVRVVLASRSRAVAEGDPANVKRQEQDRERRERKRAAVETYKRLLHTFGPKSPCVVKARDVVREWYRAPVKRGPMRTHRERVQACGDKVVLLAPAVGSRPEFMGTASVPFEFARLMLADAVDSAWGSGRFPSAWLGDGGIEVSREDRRVFRVPLGFLKSELQGFSWEDRRGHHDAEVSVHSSPLPLRTGGSLRGGCQQSTCTQANGVRSQSAPGDTGTGGAVAADCDLTAGSPQTERLVKGQGAATECLAWRAVVGGRPVLGGFLGSVQRFYGREGVRGAVAGRLPQGGHPLQRGGSLRVAPGGPAGAAILVRNSCSVSRKPEGRAGPF